ncbi:MAG: alpha/beta hydrolase [Acidobacteriaceae bacterium]
MAARRLAIAAFARLLLAVLLLAIVPRAGASAAAPPPPTPSHRLVLQSPAGITEVGLLNGAAYRIDVPKHWNHGLVVFYHGYALEPVTFHIAARLEGQQSPFFQRHYAVIQSAYSRTGWALQQAYPETEALRRYFVRRYGGPTATYVVGGSMGGQLVAVTLEINSKPYLGGLDLCGSVGPTYVNANRRFALRAAFDYYFPDVMPRLVPVPSNFEDTIVDRDKVLDALRDNPVGAMEMRNLAGLHTDADLAHNIAYWTFVVKDLQQRAGGNPFDNRNVVYAGTNPIGSGEDFELNAGVKRYASSPPARAYLVRHYSPSGRLGRPMLALHTIYDPIVQISQLALYGNEVQAAGAGQNLVQQIVNREGHCNFTEDEIGEAFEEMVRWSKGGRRPTPGVLKP